ncbi:MAG: S1/P1 nuclease [Verrucomicrobia bacterium]|nr:S1/P1 nuclease [Verrucomicrobiota bacterium]
MRNNFVLRSILLIACALLPIRSALAWGPEGHKAVAALAEELISPATKARVKAILAQDQSPDLASISVWADDARLASFGAGPLKDDPVAAAFNHDWPHNALWHFVDLPLGTEQYNETKAFVSNDDVVHAIERCTLALEGHDPEKPALNPSMALRLLVHFVGDIHQPLHCGCGYYDLPTGQPAKLIQEPVNAIGKTSDQGANLLFYDVEDRLELHAFWDVVLVTAITGSTDYHRLVEQLKIVIIENDLTSSDYHHWPETWAIDSVHEARKAYAGLTFAIPTQQSSPNATGQSLIIPITLPSGYSEKMKPIVIERLRLAADHLAALLDRIQWQ